MVNGTKGKQMRNRERSRRNSIFNEFMQFENIDDVRTEAARLKEENLKLRTELDQARNVNKRSHRLSATVHMVGDEGKARTRGGGLGRHASVLTQQVLNQKTDKPKADMILEKIIASFNNPLEGMQYFTSQAFGEDLIEIAQRVSEVYEKEDRCIHLQSPAYVFGDIHGNFEDLKFFSQNIWKLGMDLTAGKFLFLGDYVDRGLASCECIAYLFALKLKSPHKVFMLRGNHETRAVNGNEAHYGVGSFWYQCINKFGEELGEEVFEAVNDSFDRLPLSAVIDNDIFCVHGGIPRPLSDVAATIKDINNVPKVAGLDPEYEHETEESLQVASDCLWSDPADEDQEGELDDRGFGQSNRGGDAVCFGLKAIDRFLASQNYSFIMRGHQAHTEGVGLSKGAKVFTVFSTSKDHGCGEQAMCGCILVDENVLKVITRSPKYNGALTQSRNRRSGSGLPNVCESDEEKD